MTVDVTSLYMIIPHELGLGAVKYFLDWDSSLLREQVNLIMELLEFAATHNFFWFDGQYFRQDRDVAMGAKYAPSLANLCSVGGGCRLCSGETRGGPMGMIHRRYPPSFGWK